MTRPVFMSDVDGVALGLMQGLARYFEQELDEYLPIDQIVYHSRMGNSPGLKDLGERLLSRYGDRFRPTEGTTAVGRAFFEFMALKDPYAWVEPLPWAKVSIERIREYCDVVFVTATMKKFPENYASKVRALEAHFPGIPVISAPSDLKHLVQGRWAVDDRYDLCQRWSQKGVRAFCLKQPWNEAGDGHTYAWHEIAECVTSTEGFDRAMLAQAELDVLGKRDFTGEF